MNETVINPTILNRIEIIDPYNKGRLFVIYPKNVEFSLQDDKKTLKIFVNKPEKETWNNFTNMETSS